MILFSVNEMLQKVVKNQVAIINIIHMINSTADTLFFNSLI